MFIDVFAAGYVQAQAATGQHAMRSCTLQHKTVHAHVHIHYMLTGTHDADIHYVLFVLLLS
jgi:hypothetical protein